MPTKFQFESVMKLLAAGVNNYVQIRQQVGLTSEDLDDIIANADFYKRKFEEEARIEKIKELQSEQKKPWWKRKR